MIGSDQFADSVQGLRLSRALRLWGWPPMSPGPVGGPLWAGEAEGEGEGDGEPGTAAELAIWGGGEGGESESSPDICIERKYLAAAWRSCSLSSAVCRLNKDNKG